MTNSPGKSTPSRHRDVPTITAATEGLITHERPTGDEPSFSATTDVVKRVFTLPMLELESGEKLKNVVMGYECYGKLSPKGDNAILILHYFTGSSHAAGRYRPSDAEPGYWDSIIGPGKAIDTDKYFVIGVDSLTNLYCRNPMVITTGPLSINPDTNRIYGSQFPVVTLGDFTNAQYALCHFLGVTKLHAICGSSMGSMNALEWAARFPDYVSRVMGVIGGALANSPYLVAMLRQWCRPIHLDPMFKGGDYEPSAQPLRGLAAALELVTLTALSPAWAERSFQRRSADSDLSPAQALDNLFSVEAALEQTALARASLADANSFLRLAKAVQLFDVTSLKSRIRAKFLWIPAKDDKLLFNEYAERGILELRDLGLSVESTRIETDGGHLDGINEIKSKTETIRAFLN